MLAPVKPISHQTAAGKSARARLFLLLFLLAVGLWKWGDTLRAPFIKPDERPYASAVRSLQEGGSPYDEPGYFYPPVFAVTADRATQRLGELGFLIALRHLAFVGLCLAVWLSLIWAGWPLIPSLVVGTLFLLFAPAVRVATTLGNAAGLMSGLALIGLMGWKRQSVLAGISLGLSIALKPAVLLAPFLLAASRPQEPTRRHWLAASSALGVVGLLLLVGFEHLPGFVHNIREPSNPYNFSLRHLLAVLGLDLPTSLVFSLVAVAGLLWVARRPSTVRDLLVMILVVNLLAVPILWVHSLILFLPVALVALERSGGQLLGHRSVAPDERRGVPGRYVDLLALLAVVALQLAHAAGTLNGLPAWVHGPAIAVPLISIPYLGWYVLRPRATPSPREPS
jgi:hypothetical protein